MQPHTRAARSPTTSPTQRYVSEPESGNFGQVQKLPNLVTFGLETIPFMATSRFCQFWQNLAVAMLPNVATLEWHKSSKSGYLKHLPTLAIPIISNHVTKYGYFGMTLIIQFWLLQAFANFGNTYHQ